VKFLPYLKSYKSKSQSKITNKLGATISLENQVTDYPGLKVEIDDLGVEVGLSTARVKSQLAEHILKAL
jgi:F-type H+-transporting ATPase subunit delta